jgi:paraquat-inducible protein B
VAGLEVGAPVTLNGVRIGSVQSVSVQFSTAAMTTRIPVFLELERGRVQWEGRNLTDNPADWEKLIQAGLRAQLAMQSLVTGQLRVDLRFRPGTPAKLVGAVGNVPEVPEAPSLIQQFSEELSNVPLRELADTAQDALASLKRLSDHLDGKLDPLLDGMRQTLQTTDEAVRTLQAEGSATLQNLNPLLIDARRQLGVRSDELGRVLTASDRTLREAETLLQSLNGMTEPRSALRDDLEASARDLAASAQSLRSFAETVERRPNALLLGRSSR